MAFLDHVVQNPDRYTITNNNDGTYTIVPTWVNNPAEVIQQGTTIDSATLGEIDDKIGILTDDVTGVTQQLADKATKEQEIVNLALNKNTYTLKPLVTFIDDDGRLATYDKIKPLFDSKGVKFVSAVSSGLIGNVGYMTRTQIDELHASGHEISAHSVNHNSAITHPKEIKQAYDTLKEMGYDVENLVYVGGDYNNAAIKESKKYYNSAVAVDRGTNKSPVRSFAIKRYAVGSMWSNATWDGISENGTYASYQAMVDKAISEKSWLVIMMHSWNAQHDTTQQQYLSDLIDYIKTNNVEIVTLKEGLKKYGNKIDIGDIGNATDGYFAIGSGGKIESPDLDKRIVNVVVEDDTSITNATPYSAFPKGKQHIAIFRSGKAVGFPASAGTLITYHMNYNWASWQYWYSYNDFEKVYYRKWNDSTNVWGGWKILDYSVLANIPKINEERYLLPVQTVPANSNITLSIPLTIMGSYSIQNSVIQAIPYGGIEQNISWHVTVDTAKNVKLTLFNHGTVERGLSERYWAFKAIV